MVVCVTNVIALLLIYLMRFGVGLGDLFVLLCCVGLYGCLWATTVGFLT